MELTVNLFITLDGVIQGPGGPEEDRSGGFDRGGWLVPFVDDDFGRIVGGWFEKPQAFLLGRRTYDIMSAYWPSVTDTDDDTPVKLNTLPKYVPSSTLTDPSWSHTTVLSGLDEVAALKAQPGGELQVHGSGALAASLLEAGLVDELRLLVFPVAVGAGKRLFHDVVTAFDLVDSAVTSTGVVYQALRPRPFVSGDHVIVDGRETLV
ncbi:MAG TPA: dihydrofolate reductase family protein [Rhodoglobus sp.]|nr:dihydrofolate reductase family protein [Rhodoglobus sp.]